MILDKTTIFGYLLCLLPAILIINGCDTSTSPPSSTLYTPGVYTAEARGQIGRIKVTVTFSEDAIEQVVLTECYESIDREEVANAVESIPAAIVERQTLLIDAISNATVASNAILKAVEDCVKQAGGDEAVAKLKESGIAQFIALYRAG
jgi:fumarate reductase flavoprotein subunit